jgi:prepilin-type N-terminal cleavage/methylation domain-containing protein
LACRGAARDERGMALTELLVAVAILAPVLAATMSFSLLSLRSESRTTGRAQGIVAQQNAFYAMTKKIRQGRVVRPWNCCFTTLRPWGIRVQKEDGTHFRIDCTFQDTRPGRSDQQVCNEFDPESSSTPVRRLQGVADQPIFDVTNENYVRISVTLNVDNANGSGGNGSIRLVDSVYLRNSTS